MKLVLAITAVVSLSFGGGGGKVMQHPWRKFERGTWIKTQITDTRGPRLFATDTLLKTNPKGYSLETVHEMEGLEAWSVRRDFDYAFFGFAHIAPAAQMMGRERLTVMGRRLQTRLWERRWNDESGSHRVETWTADNVPVPVRIAMESGSNELDLWLVGRHDPIEVGDELIECARYEGVMRDPDGNELEALQWRSDAVPGGVVLTVTTRADDGHVWTHEARVIDFGLPPEED